MVSNRIKEVSIRKVFGAGVFHLMYLISKNYFVLILFANATAWPVAYLALQQWLESFAYRINISWHFFVAAAITTLIIAFLTVGNRIYWTSTANPIDHLKDE